MQRLRFRLTKSARNLYRGKNKAQIFRRAEPRFRHKIEEFRFHKGLLLNESLEMAQTN